MHTGLIRTWLVLLTSVLLLALPGASEAQTPSLEEQFARHASDHDRALRDLFSMRAMRQPPKREATLENVQQWLASKRIDNSPGHPEGTAVLFYAHEGDQLAIYLITPAGILAHHIVTVTEEDLRDSATLYRLGLNVDGIERSRAPVWRGEKTESPAKPPPTTSTPDWDSPIHEILLPGPILAKLAEVRHLIIVANGAVATNPFAAFPLNETEVLVDRMSITVAPSLFDIDQMIRPWSGLDRSTLLVGDPIVPESEEWDVPRLPGALREVQMLSERVPGGTVFVGEDATKTAVVSAMRRARVLYFAAHGVSDPLEPLTGGFLMLAGPTPQESFLTAREVQRMRLRAELVVLSACQSGLGFNHEGGVIGLARAFQKAGAPRVVMSLWSVSDEATVDLMDRFQLELQDTFPAEALRRAMIEARKKHPDPALWAGFTLFGTPR